MGDFWRVGHRDFVGTCKRKRVIQEAEAFGTSEGENLPKEKSGDFLFVPLALNGIVEGNERRIQIKVQTHQRLNFSSHENAGELGEVLAKYHPQLHRCYAITGMINFKTWMKNGA